MDNTSRENAVKSHLTLQLILQHTKSFEVVVINQGTPVLARRPSHPELTSLDILLVSCNLSLACLCKENTDLWLFILKNFLQVLRSASGVSEQVYKHGELGVMSLGIWPGRPHFLFLPAGMGWGAGQPQPGALADFLQFSPKTVQM